MQLARLRQGGNKPQQCNISVTYVRVKCAMATLSQLGRDCRVTRPKNILVHKLHGMPAGAGVNRIWREGRASPRAQWCISAM